MFSAKYIPYLHIQVPVLLNKVWSFTRPFNDITTHNFVQGSCSLGIYASFFFRCFILFFLLRENLCKVKFQVKYGGKISDFNEIYVGPPNTGKMSTLQLNKLFLF